MKIRFKQYLQLFKEKYQKIAQKIKSTKLIQKFKNDPKFASNTASISIGAVGAALIATSVSILIASFSSLFIIEIILLILLGLVGIALFPLAVFVYRKLLTVVISDDTKDKIIDILDKLDGNEDIVE